MYLSREILLIFRENKYFELQLVQPFPVILFIHEMMCRKITVHICYENGGSLTESNQEKRADSSTIHTSIFEKI